MKSAWKPLKIWNIAYSNPDTLSTKDNWEYANYLDTSNITEGEISELQLITNMEKLPSRARRKVIAGDIVYSTVRPIQKHYGIIDFPSDNMLVSTGFTVLRAKKEICDYRYLFYFLTQNDVIAYLQTLAEQNTSAYPSIRPSDIESLEIALPPLPIQKCIAHILGSLDDKIELNRQMNQTMEAMVKAIFKSWFVDFDPVKAIAEGKPTGLPPHIEKLFPDSFEESELGMIPKGWRVERVSEVCNFEYGKTLKSENRKDGKYPVMGSGGQIGWHNEFVVKGPGIVVGRKGNAGAVKWVHEDFYPIDTTFYILSNSKDMPLSYLYQSLLNMNLASFGADSAVPGLNRNAALSKRIIVPPSSLLKYFDGVLSCFESQQYIVNQQTQLLANTRDELLPKLLNGEIEI